MYNGYQKLNALPAHAFLNPENFTTRYDTRFPDRALQQYAIGLRISRESKRIGISANGTWFAEGKDGSFTSSYEGIGYHAHTAALLRGFLAGPAEVVVHRYSGLHHTTSTIIKPASR